MAEFNHPEHEARFTLPDEPTIRQRLLYDGVMMRGLGNEMFTRLWEAAKLVVEDWECEEVPIDIDLNTVGDEKVITVIEWAGLAAFSWRESLKADRLPKN